MRIGLLGTGVVGQTLGGRLVELGHEVRMGARQAGGDAATAWAARAGSSASEGTFADAAAFGSVVVNATAGEHSLDALRAAGADNLRGKLLVDVANAIAHGTGFPPQLSVANSDSLAEQIQRAFPDARVVKTLNTVNCDVMVRPSIVPGTHNVFVCGEDGAAKAEVVELLVSFGWPRESVVDLGGIQAARGTEMYLLFWINVMRTLQTAHFNVALLREG